MSIRKNIPRVVISGFPFKVRIWENELGLGRSELKADFVRVSDGGASPSFSQEEMESLHQGSGEALRLMRKHQRRQNWLNLLFRW